ncbi:hypothetical protein MRB53_042123 [Persea americana]|nr:hypothetical protein MRB53_042123 [Persea americana]
MCQVLRYECCIALVRAKTSGMEWHVSAPRQDNRAPSSSCQLVELASAACKRMDCLECKGTGKDRGAQCAACNGTGRATVGNDAAYRPRPPSSLSTPAMNRNAKTAAS